MAQIITEMLDVSPGGIPPIIHLSQYDKLTRTIVFNLIDDTGTYAIPSGAIATVRGTKPDKTGFEYEGIISGNTVTVNVQDQMTVCAGRIPCEIRISGFDESVLGTANFLLDIEPAALLDNTTISETELPLIEQATEAVAPTLAAAKEAKTYASEAGTSETNASGYAAQSKNSAAAASSSASEASGYATQSKNSAAAASSSASEASGYATQSKNSAAAASSSASEASSYAAQAKANAENAANAATTVVNENLQEKVDAAKSAASAAAESETNAADSAKSAGESATKAAGYAGAAEYSLGFDPDTGLFGIFHNTEE